MSVEKRLKKAVEHATPNMRDEVIAKCKNATAHNDRLIIMKNSRNKRRERILSFISAAAIFLLVLNVAVDIYMDRVKNTVETIIDIDVNPSIELSINKDDRIISVRAVNDDALDILDGMELTGTQTKVAVNAIIGSMFEHGYLKGETNSILVSVENKSPEKSEEIQNNITADIDNLLQAYNQEVKVISQTMDDDDDLGKMAETYGISVGKATLIKKIIEKNDIYTIEELVNLNITELNEIICSMDEGDIMEPEPDDIPEPVQPDEPEPDDTPEPIISDQPAVSDNYVPDDSVSDNSVSDNDIDLGEDDIGGIIGNSESSETEE